MISLGAGLAASSFSSEMAQAQSSPASKPAQPVVVTSAGDDVGPIVPSSGAGRYFHVFYPASQKPDELQIAVNYTLWMPDDIQTVRGVIVHQHGAGLGAAHAGAYSAYDLHWQALARKWDCVLLGPTYRVINDAIDLTPGGAELWFDPRHGSDKTFLRSLDEIGSQSGHPEIATVPWALWGHSGGGIWSNAMSNLYPSRIAAVFLRSGTDAMFRTKLEFRQPEVPEEVYAIPTMVNAGIQEKKNLPWAGSIATFREFRAYGAPIGWAPDPRTGHACGDSRYLAIPFFDACLAMRLPEKGARTQALRPVDQSQGWLVADAGDTAVPASEFKGDPRQAIWLPSAAVARIWMDYVKTGGVANSGIPPAPFNVRVNDKGDQGKEVTWDAVADIESGLGGFIVLRDGQGVARLPAQPPEQVFGSPLFQGLSFHDTPYDPLPRMAYLDASAKPGVDHVYTVIALSSAGVPSLPIASPAEMRSLERNKNGSSTKQSVGMEFYGLPPIGQKQRRPMDGAQFHPPGVGEAGGRLERNKNGSSTKQSVGMEFYGLPPIGQKQRRPMDGAQFHSLWVGEAGGRLT
jgi:hypothetical protein